MGLINKMLKKHIKIFVKKIEGKHGISLKFLRGECELEHLELHEDVIAEIIAYPNFQVTKAVCAGVRLKVPWRKIHQQASSVVINTLHLELVEPVEIRPVPTPLATAFPSREKSKNGKMSRFIFRVRESLRVQINAIRVTVRCLGSDRPFMDVALRGVAVTTTNSNWEPAEHEVIFRVPKDISEWRVRRLLTCEAATISLRSSDGGAHVLCQDLPFVMKITKVLGSQDSRTRETIAELLIDKFSASWPSSTVNVLYEFLRGMMGCVGRSSSSWRSSQSMMNDHSSSTSSMMSLTPSKESRLKGTGKHRRTNSNPEYFGDIKPYRRKALIATSASSSASSRTSSSSDSDDDDKQFADLDLDDLVDAAETASKLSLFPSGLELDYGAQKKPSTTTFIACIHSLSLHLELATSTSPSARSPEPSSAASSRGFSFHSTGLLYRMSPDQSQPATPSDQSPDATSLTIAEETHPRKSVQSERTASFQTDTGPLKTTTSQKSSGSAHPRAAAGSPSLEGGSQKNYSTRNSTPSSGLNSNSSSSGKIITVKMATFALEEMPRSRHDSQKAPMITNYRMSGDASTYVADPTFLSCTVRKSDESLICNICLTLAQFYAGFRPWVALINYVREILPRSGPSSSTSKADDNLSSASRSTRKTGIAVMVQLMMPAFLLAPAKDSPELLRITSTETQITWATHQFCKTPIVLRRYFERGVFHDPLTSLSPPSLFPIHDEMDTIFQVDLAGLSVSLASWDGRDAFELIQRSDITLEVLQRMQPWKVLNQSADWAAQRTQATLPLSQGLLFAHELHVAISRHTVAFARKLFDSATAVLPLLSTSSPSSSIEKGSRNDLPTVPPESTRGRGSGSPDDNRHRVVDQPTKAMPAPPPVPMKPDGRPSKDDHKVIRRPVSKTPPPQPKPKHSPTANPSTPSAASKSFHVPSDSDPASTSSKSSKHTKTHMRSLSDLGIIPSPESRPARSPSSTPSASSCQPSADAEPSLSSSRQLCAALPLVTVTFYEDSAERPAQVGKIMISEIQLRSESAEGQRVSRLGANSMEVVMCGPVVKQPPPRRDSVSASDSLLDVVYRVGSKACPSLEVFMAGVCVEYTDGALAVLKALLSAWPTSSDASRKSSRVHTKNTELDVSLSLTDCELIQRSNSGQKVLQTEIRIPTLVRKHKGPHRSVIYAVSSAFTDAVHNDKQTGRGGEGDNGKDGMKGMQDEVEAMRRQLTEARLNFVAASMQRERAEEQLASTRSKVQQIESECQHLREDRDQAWQRIMQANEALETILRDNPALEKAVAAVQHALSPRFQQFESSKDVSL